MASAPTFDDGGDDDQLPPRPAQAKPGPIDDLAPNREERERRDRFQADAELFELLRADGFAGQRWERFANELADYGLGVLCAWARQGFLGEKLTRCRARVRLTEDEAEMMERDADYRNTLIDAAVGEAVASFRKLALEGKGWDRDKGASIATYFIRACLFKLSNEVGRERRSEAHRLETLARAYELQPSAGDDAWDDQPGHAVVDAQVIESHLATLSTQDRRIVLGRASQYSLAEISELYDIPEQVVRRRWRRLVKNVAWVARLGARG